MTDAARGAPPVSRLAGLRTLWPFVQRHRGLFASWLIALGAHRGERAVHRSGVGEGVTHAQHGGRRALDLVGEAQAFGRTAAVGTNQATGAELDAAVPARDHHDHAVDALAVDRREDRPPRSA